MHRVRKGRWARPLAGMVGLIAGLVLAGSVTAADKAAGGQTTGAAPENSRTW